MREDLDERLHAAAAGSSPGRVADPVEPAGGGPRHDAIQHDVGALAHGDVAPQPVDTDALPEVGEEWLTENPYREAEAGRDVWLKAIEVGASGYNQNCARCHGLEVISGAPSEYEVQRLHNIAQNKQKLQMLGLEDSGSTVNSTSTGTR